VKRYSYVIVADASSGAGSGGPRKRTETAAMDVADGAGSRASDRQGPARRLPGSGRHRPGVPGTVVRYPAGPPRPSGRRRACHYRRTRPPSGFAVRYATLLVLLAAIGVSGWFAANGATAVAQMIQP
jgi:hypothetical protein